jgi:HTH-type transcriptional regulator / antitoxin HigA
MNVKPIKSERDYRRVLKEIETLMDAKANSPEGDRLDILVTLAEAWEAKHHPIDAPDPVAAIEFAMDQRGLSRRDLEPYIGSRARVAEVLNHKRSLTLPMIRRLYAGLGIPADVLIREHAMGALAHG